MKKLTRTLLGTLLLAGSATAALAVGPSQDTLNGQNSAGSGAQLSQNQNQGQPDQNQPMQNKPNTTEGMWSQDLAAAGTTQPTQPATTATNGQNTTSDPAASSSTGSPSMSSSSMGNSGVASPAARTHRSPHRVAKSDAAGDRMTNALNILSSDGYTNVQSLTPQGDQFVANVTQNGRNLSVVVDPQTGRVTNRS